MEECKYKIKKNKMENTIDDDLDNESDNESDNEENLDYILVVSWI